MQPGATSLGFALLFTILALLFYIGMRLCDEYTKSESNWALLMYLSFVAAGCFLLKYSLWDPNPFKGHGVYGNRALVLAGFVVACAILIAILYRLTAKRHANKNRFGSHK